MEMKILGLDISLNCTGLSIYEDGRIIFYDTIEHPKNTSLEQKFTNIGNYMEKLLDTYQVDIASIEQVFMGYQGDTSLKLSKVHGIMIRELDRHKVKYIYYEPSEIKKTVLGHIPMKEHKGKTKLLVAAEIFKLFPEIPTTVKDDITDSVAAIVTYLRKCNE
jgi:crossover junction endodeoxyribonuclease RuvC